MSAQCVLRGALRAHLGMTVLGVPHPTPHPEEGRRPISKGEACLAILRGPGRDDVVEARPIPLGRLFFRCADIDEARDALVRRQAKERAYASNNRVWSAADKGVRVIPSGAGTSGTSDRS